MAEEVHYETASAGSNLAVIKYWGKADKKLNTPINSSVSVALSQDDLCTVTTVAASRLGGDGSGGGEEASKSPAARAATELELSSVSSCAADEPPKMKKGADA